MKVKLIFPPFWMPSHPYLSVPSLVAFLQRQGLDVTQVDLRNL